MASGPLGTKRRRERRQNRRASRHEDTIAKAREEEIARQQEVRKQEMQREIFQTQEGGGVMEGAAISLGFDEDEDDLFNSLTGLVV